MAMTGEISLNTLFRRCVQCPSTTPSCPDCDSGTSCSLSVQTCDNCASTSCVADASATTSIAASSSNSGHSGPSVGAIVGGTLGGVIAIALATYLVWRFCIKNKRQQYEQEDWAEEGDDNDAAEKETFTMRRDARASTHTVGSIASTVLTRASNVIQIAYIPGVTNRSGPTTPGLLVPPVPPIPLAHSSAANAPGYEDQHFFMPGDLRDSTYSGISDRTSYAPRSSVASTIYGKNAVVSPVPAQTVIRGKAAMVSVRSNNGLHTEYAPPVPNVDPKHLQNNNGPPSPAFSVGSTFLNSASAATPMRPTMVKVATIGGPKSKDSKSTLAPEDADSILMARDSNTITIIDDTPTVDQGPFRDPEGAKRNGSLGDLTGDAARKAHGASIKRDNTPFGDENEMRN